MRLLLLLALLGCLTMSHGFGSFRGMNDSDKDDDNGSVEADEEENDFDDEEEEESAEEDDNDDDEGDDEEEDEDEDSDEFTEEKEEEEKREMVGFHERMAGMSKEEQIAYLKKHCPFRNKTEPFLQLLNVTYLRMLHLPPPAEDAEHERADLLKDFVQRGIGILKPAIEAMHRHHHHHHHHHHPHGPHGRMEFLHLNPMSGEAIRMYMTGVAVGNVLTAIYSEVEKMYAAEAKKELKEEERKDFKKLAYKVPFSGAGGKQGFPHHGKTTTPPQHNGMNKAWGNHFGGGWKKAKHPRPRPHMRSRITSQN